MTLFFFNWLRNGQQGTLPGTVEFDVQNGREAWELNGDVYVQISGHRDFMISLNSIATANIFVGTS